ncbi:Arm DNA-binding domain-containing protein [Turicimonas muris]|uniref:Arm DNA-binding domain-containing protein n=1 Tax=Turicimonas muris TaxID=1796652 RepID=UPI0025A683E3|nr:Arm DNA-binding domain-containing protein [Turicimonas muris]
MKLTSKQIKGLKPREKRYQITDEGGLALRVQPSGVKSWVLRIPQSGRVLDLTLGHWPEISSDVYSSIYKVGLNTVQPTSLRILVLIRAY